MLQTLLLFATTLISLFFSLSDALLSHVPLKSSSYRRQLQLQASLKVALTRELGTNDKLSKLLSNNKNIQCIELPCIQFFDGDDTDKVKSEIPKNDVIILTSPQGASVFLNAWESIGKPTVKVAVVGKGTAQPLLAQGITPFFQPSDFTGEVLAKELPDNCGKTILYPTSSLADNKLESALRERGFLVTRLNSYKTGPAIWSSSQLELAKTCDIVTFASPSAVRTWVERVGTNTVQEVVVIGPTSEKAAAGLGFSRIHSPEEGSKGLEPWAELISKVADQALLRQKSL